MVVLFCLSQILWLFTKDYPVRRLKVKRADIAERLQKPSEKYPRISGVHGVHTVSGTVEIYIG